ncbi:MAG: hypothetical protein V7785_11895 [Bermanella sp.]
MSALTIKNSRNEEDCLKQRASDEINQWYEMFYQWSRGLCKNEEKFVRPIFDALAEDFHVVLTNGVMMNKHQYWQRLLTLYGSRSGDAPSRIVNLKLNTIEEDHVLAVFDLIKDGESNKKFDSALLRLTKGTPNGVEWLYVHESAHDIIPTPQPLSPAEILKEVL